MPAIQRGQAYRLGPNKWGLRYYDQVGVRRRQSPFPSKSAALAYYRDVIEPQLRGESVAMPELTLTELVDLYLERHAATVRPRTITTLRERLAHATKGFGEVPLRDLERMSGEIASWRAGLPERTRYDLTQALRQTLEAAVRWGYMQRNPAKLAGRNPQPPPRPVRDYTNDELEAIAAELSLRYQPLPAFAAATGLRPEEWQVLERRDIDRGGGCPQRAANRLQRRHRGVGKDHSQPTPGAALEACPGRARGAATPARHATSLPGTARRAPEPRYLPSPRVGPRHRGLGSPEAGAHLRPQEHVRLERSRSWHLGVRARANHGHERADD